ncbi:MAG TPA: histidine kinase dimerization/phospho-acceptor domain-containing protein [Xylella sp.]
MLKTAKWISGRLSQRPDSEHLQNFIRVFIVSLFIVYLSVCWYYRTDLNQWEIIWLVLFTNLGVSLALMMAMVIYPQISHVRRCIGILTDYMSMTALMLLMDEAGSPLYVVCLWVTIGHGMRYGSTYLLAATVLGAFSFLTVILISPYWKSNPFLAWSLLIGLIAIPLYFQSLLKAWIQALKDAWQVNEAKSRFLANMSHEFRTPLNGLSGITEVLATTRLDTEQRECLKTIQTSVHSLLSLIEEVLDISRIEAGKIRILHEPFSLQEVIDGVGLILQLQIRNKKLEYRVDVGSDVPEWMLGDVGYVRQVLLNIVGNAVKFTERGWVTLSVSVLNRSGHHSVVLRFEVADTGIGVPLDMRSRLFDVFEQANTGLNRRYQGSGLGTTIAKGLIESMGGRIGFEENVPCGSLFWFELLFELVQQPVVAQEATRESQLPEANNVIAFSDPFLRHRARVNSMRVLVADDHETNRMVLSRILGKAGHKVLCVEGAEAVLDCLIGMEFDVVIVDLHMPGVSGLDMLKQLRVMQSGGGMPCIPVLVLSADATSDSIRYCEEAGARAFLPKPVLATTLLDVLAGIAEGGDRVLPCNTLLRCSLQKHQVFDPSGLDELVQLNMGDSFEEQFILESLRDIEHCQQAMLSAAEANQWQGMRDQAHALRGVLGYLGLMRASSLAAEMMSIPDWQLESEWPDRVHALHEELRCGRDALEARRRRGILP